MIQLCLKIYKLDFIPGFLVDVAGVDVDGAAVDDFSYNVKSN